MNAHVDDLDQNGGGRRRRGALESFVPLVAAAFCIGALAVPSALASPSGRDGTATAGPHAHEAKLKPCKKTRGGHHCRHRSKPTTPGSPTGPAAPMPNPGGPSPAPAAPGPGPGVANNSPAAQFASALVGTTYERYTSSLLGSDFTDDYTFCANNTFLEHTESYAAGSYVVGDYNGTWNVTNALSATSANVAYTTNNPNLPSSGTVLITVLSNGISVAGNDYYIKGPASC